MVIKKLLQSCGAAEMSPARNPEVVGLIPGLAQWVKDPGIAMSCGVGRRLSWDLFLLWLWWRLAAVALIGPLAWEPPCASGAALKSKQTKKQKQTQTNKNKPTTKELQKNDIFLPNPRFELP